MMRLTLSILLTLSAAGCYLTEPHPEITEIGAAELPGAVLATLERRVPEAEIARVEAWTYLGEVTQYDVTVLSTDGEKIYGLYPDGRYSPLSEATEHVWAKVEINLAQLDAAGLRGSPDGKVSVSYEFAIPNTADCKAQVRAIDRTVQFMPGSRGRIGAAGDQCLCIGSTHQKNHRSVLRALAELPYVERIIECHFE
jgi:hypothetical protein